MNKATQHVIIKGDIRIDVAIPSKNFSLRTQYESNGFTFFNHDVDIINSIFKRVHMNRIYFGMKCQLHAI